MACDRIVGVAFGLPHEPVGVVLVERVETVTDEWDGRRWETAVQNNVSGIWQMPGGTRYAEVADLLAEIKPAFMLVDISTCGRPPLDLLWDRKLRPQPVFTVESDAAKKIRGALFVPQRDLISGLAIVLGDRRLAVAREHELAPTLARELTEFRTKPLKPDPLHPATEVTTTELVQACALAVWYGEHRMRSRCEQPRPPRTLPEIRTQMSWDEAAKWATKRE